MQKEQSGVMDALRSEPERAAILLKLSVVAAAGVVAWDVLAAMVLPDPAVKLVLALLVLAYGATMTYLAARILVSSRQWASGSDSAAARLALPGKGQAAAPDTPAPGDSGGVPVAFNESYFLMRLQEQVKDARRGGYEMCVAAVHVTLPGMDMTPEVAEAVAYDVARIASEQARLMSLPLALGDAEFVFSLPHTGLEDTKQFVREVLRALGEYWCYFGIATFPDHATTAQALVEKAREACEASLQTGRRGRVEYSVA
jgi:GGDEF domain-containing protein